MSWPKLTTTIYPKQSLRVNTGWSTQSMPGSMTMTSMPHRNLIGNGIIAMP